MNRGDSVKVYAFVGESGSGKSYRAMWVASENNIECIVDDGLLIRGNELLAGSSAKREPTKLGSVRRALFYEEDHAREVRQAIALHKPSSILILGTSDKMVNEIAQRLELGKIESTIRIEQIASRDEIERAKSIRKTQGKHVIPVPTFEIKKDFSGVLLDTLHIFNVGRRGKIDFRATKSVVRPNFSYRGDYHISDNAIITMCQIEAKRVEGVGKNMRCQIESGPDGVYISLDISVKYGYDVRDVARKVYLAVPKAIYEYTAINVCRTDVNIRWIDV